MLFYFDVYFISKDNSLFFSDYNARCLSSKNIASTHLVTKILQK